MPQYEMVYRCTREGTGWADPPCTWSTTNYSEIDEHENQIEPGHVVIGSVEKTED